MWGCSCWGHACFWCGGNIRRCGGNIRTCGGKSQAPTQIGNFSLRLRQAKYFHQTTCKNHRSNLPRARCRPNGPAEKPQISQLKQGPLKLSGINIRSSMQMSQWLRSFAGVMVRCRFQIASTETPSGGGPIIRIRTGSASFGCVFPCADVVQHLTRWNSVSLATNALCAARKGTKNIGSVCSMTSIFAAIALFHR